MKINWGRVLGLAGVGVFAGIGEILGQILTDKLMLASMKDEESEEKGGKEEDEE